MHPWFSNMRTVPTFILPRACVWVVGWVQTPLWFKLPADRQADGCQRRCADGQTLTYSSPPLPPILSHQPSLPPPPPLAQAFLCTPRCAAVGQAGRDGKQKERKSGEAHGVKGETFIITIVSSSLIPPPPSSSLTAQMSCLFNTPELSPHSPHPSSPPLPSLSNLGPANPSSTPAQLLHSPFAPLLFLPSLSMGSHCVWRTRERGRGKGEKKRGREKEPERGREGGRAAGLWL